MKKINLKFHEDKGIKNLKKIDKLDCDNDIKQIVKKKIKKEINDNIK